MYNYLFLNYSVTLSISTKWSLSRLRLFCMGKKKTLMKTWGRLRLKVEVDSI